MPILKDFFSAVKEIISSGAQLNRKLRKEITQTVGELGDQLEASIVMVNSYFLGRKSIAGTEELVEYLRNARGKLLQTYHEFHICQGLYELRDRFHKQFFDPTRAAVTMGRKNQIGNLLNSLAAGERGIIDDLTALFDKVDAEVNQLEKLSKNPAQELAQRRKLDRLIEREMKKLNNERAKVKTAVRSIIDNL
jgi:hypothetical protein